MTDLILSSIPHRITYRVRLGGSQVKGELLGFTSQETDGTQSGTSVAFIRHPAGTALSGQQPIQHPELPTGHCCLETEKRGEWDVSCFSNKLP